MSLQVPFSMQGALTRLSALLSISVLGSGCIDSTVVTKFEPAVLSDGTVVQSLGACDANLDRCWTYDGVASPVESELIAGRTTAIATAVAEAFGADSGDAVGGARPGAYLWVRATIEDPDNLPSLLFLSESGDAVEPSFVYTGFPDAENLLLAGYDLGVRVNPSVAATVLAAVGPWQSVGVYSINSGKLTHESGFAFNPIALATSVDRLGARFPATATAFVSTEREPRIRVSLQLPETAGRLAWRVVAFGSNAQELESCGSMTRPGVASRDYEFRGRLDDLARIELQSREYESVPTQTVLLRPQR